MRFDDSLETALAGDIATPFGAQSLWRQLVDLIGRGRAAATPEVLARLAALRDQVPASVRAASARAAAAGDPPAGLVRLFVGDTAAVAAPLLRAARFDAETWIALLPAMSPSARAVLRHRRDLPAEVTRALAAFGAVDFRLVSDPAPVIEPAVVPFEVDATDEVVAVDVATPEPALSAEAMKSADFAAQSTVPAPAATTQNGIFEIAELVARIDAFQRDRDVAPPPALLADHETQAELFDIEAAPARQFRFETDAAGIVRWIEGASRAALIGLSLDHAAASAVPQVDGGVSGAFRRRASFADARLLVGGESDAAGPWRISGLPVFDRASGRFTGYRGTARRPRADEIAESMRADHGRPEGLRALVHELRTPANAIMGFAEMIETQLYGPVPTPYRDHATVIRDQAHALIGAIEDIDLAARIDSDTLDLRPIEVEVAPLLARVADDLASLAALREARLTVDAAPGLAIAADDRAIERLVTRLAAALLAATDAGEGLAIVATPAGDHEIALRFDRPRAFAGIAEGALLHVDAEAGPDAAGASLLGTGFALRLARNLAIELGGSLAFDADALTLRLPAAFVREVEQASSN